MTTLKKQNIAIASAIAVLLIFSGAESFSQDADTDCEGTVMVVFPTWMSSSTGRTCCSDPKGLDENGVVDQDIPATPPGDAIWVKGTPDEDCKDCKTVSTFKVFDKDGEEIDSGTEPMGSHPADGGFHRI